MTKTALKIIADDLPLTPPQVLSAALAAAAEQSRQLYAGIKLIEALGNVTESAEMEISGEALQWIAKKLHDDVDRIMSHVDSAQNAAAGKVYATDSADYRKYSESGS